MKKRLLAMALAWVMASQTIMTCYGAEEKEEDEDILGRISIVSSYAAKDEWDAVLHDEELILMTPEDIGRISGADVVYDGSGKICEISRGKYRVEVDLEKKEARVCIDMMELDGASVIIEPYNCGFPLEYVTEMEVKGQKKDFVPLEVMMYLLNVQWKCQGGWVYTFTPKETLWNIVGEYLTMTQDLPRQEDVVGESVWQYYGNHLKYATLAAADEIDVQFLIPIWGSNRFDQKKLTDALLLLSGSCTNIDEGRAVNAAESLSGHLSDVSQLVTEFAGVSGGAESGLELGQGFSLWMDVDIDLVDVGIVATSIGEGLNVGLTACRYIFWDKEFLRELEYLSGLKDKVNTDFCDKISKAAKGLYSENENLVGNLSWEAAKTAGRLVFDELTGLTIGGKVVAVYSGMVTVAKSNFPLVEKALETGDQANLALHLGDLSRFMSARYNRTLKELQGKNITQDVIDEVRLTGFLTMNAASHSWDCLYTLRKKEGKGTEDVETALVRDFAAATRIAESAQYDPSLLLYPSYQNIHETGVTGAQRCLIPPEYVRYGVPILYSSSIAAYNGKYYISRDQGAYNQTGGGKTLEEMGLTPLGIEPAQYDYIASFAIYKGKVYYTCKEAGTSDFRSAFYSCNLDGSGQTMLRDITGSSSEFYIRNNRLYGYWDVTNTNYLDLATGEWGAEEYYYVPGMYSNQYNSEYQFVALEDGIHQWDYKSEDGSNTDMGCVAGVPYNGLRVHVQAAGEDAVYYTYWNENQAFLFRYNIDTGTVEEMDSHLMAGGGSDAYFNW